MSCLPNGVFVTGLKLPAPVGVNVGVDPKAVNEAIIVGGSCFGISNPRNFKFTNLHAMLNSLMFILPSRSVSASALQNHSRLISNCLYIETIENI